MNVSIKRTICTREWVYYTYKEGDRVYYVRRYVDSGEIDVSKDGQRGWLRVSPDQKVSLRNLIDVLAA